MKFLWSRGLSWLGLDLNHYNWISLSLGFSYWDFTIVSLATLGHMSSREQRNAFRYSLFVGGTFSTISLLNINNTSVHTHPPTKYLQTGIGIFKTGKTNQSFTMTETLTIPSRKTWLVRRSPLSPGLARQWLETEAKQPPRSPTRVPCSGKSC